MLRGEATGRRLQVKQRLTGFIAVTALVCGALAGAGSKRLTQTGIDAAAYLASVRYLASDEMKGRGTGRPELDKAAHFLASEFHKAGLAPVNGGSYLQPFPVNVNPHLNGRSRAAYTIA